MWVFPIASVCLILLSMLSAFQGNIKKEGITPKMLAFNGLLLFSLVVFLFYYLQDERTIFDVPAPLYWFLLALGIVIGLVSVGKRYIPGFLTSAALLVFVGFVALLSLGFLLMILAGVELLVAVYFQLTLKNRA